MGDVTRGHAEIGEPAPFGANLVLDAYMTANPTKARRRFRQGVGGHVRLQVRVAPEEVDRLTAAADALGVPVAVVMDAILRRLELDESGRPVWWDDELDAPARLTA